MKVVAGIDGTERSYHAIELASQVMSPDQDQIILYFAPPDFRLASKSEISKDLPALAKTALAESVFDKAKERLPEAFRATVTTIVGDNKPCDGIMATVDQHEADLVVIGAHSSTRRLPLFVGGSARKIAHDSKRPVLLVRETQQESKDGIKVLLCCDDEELWCEAASVLSQLSWPPDTTAMLLHVIETIDDAQVDQIAEQARSAVPNANSLIDEYRSLVERRKTERVEKLTTARASFHTIVRDATPHVKLGHVVETIVKTVQEHEIDLVVVGARRLGRIGRLLGSTTEALLVQCPCSLLIVHPNEST